MARKRGWRIEAKIVAEAKQEADKNLETARKRGRA